jgi:uncharacterized protein involved in exopolysaccharide biosynthesis
MPGSNAHLLEAQRPRTHAMRRRVLVFFGVFLVCAAASLAYTFMRPAIYMADARVQVTPSDLRPSGAASGPRDMSQAFLMELQILSSRPLLEKVAKRLAGANTAVNVEEQVLSLQEMLSVKPVEGTNVVLLEARSPDRLAVARLVNTVIDVYRETQAVTGKSAEETQLADARETVRLMDEKVAAKRRAAEEFRIRSNIVSAERDENETLSRLKGLGTSLAAAAEREAKAEGRVRALEQAANDSKRTVQSKDNPTVAGMEVRLSQLREEWRAMERQFTPQYLDMDQNARGLKQRIANLEQQIDVERQKSQQSALAEARDELASVKTSSQRLQQQLTDDRQNVQGFTRRFAEFKVMQDELKGLDEMRQVARQRLITLEATATERKPRMMVVEPAAIPESAWRPLYARDAGIAVVASLLLGFLAVWFVEFFNRTEPVLAGPSTVIIPQPWMQGSHSHGPALGGAPAAQALAHHPGGPAEVGLLARPLPRELTQREVQMLLAAASPEHLLVLVCLLCGLGPEEIAALRVEHLHIEADGAHSLHIPGESPRVLSLIGPLAGLSAAADPAAQALPLIPAANGQPLKTDDIAAAVTSSAFDSGLDQPQSITPESLRHTYVAFLVRQGLKFGDMGRIVGKLSPDMLNALAPLAPHGERRPISDIVRMMPAVLDLSDPA